MADKYELTVVNSIVDKNGHGMKQSRFGIFLIIFALFPFFFTDTAISREMSSGSCANFDFSPFRKGDALEWNGVARVVRHGSVLLVKGSDGTQKQKLTFNQQAKIVAERDSLLKLSLPKLQGKPKVEGWAYKKDFLCQTVPIKSEGGLEMKFFIKTSPVARDSRENDPTVTLFQDSALKSCLAGDSRCKGLASNFKMYFVFDQSKDALLLADRYRLKSGDKLLGWVSRRDGVLWNNAFGIRPREDLASPDGKGTGAICTYKNLKDAVSRNWQACQPVIGGKSWFQSPMRIPVLDMVDSAGQHIDHGSQIPDINQPLFYKVALGRPSLVGRRVGDGKVAISKDLAQKIIPDFVALNAKKNVSSLTAKKKVDIFFLLDATSSMDSVFDAVRGTDEQQGVIQEIINSVTNAPGFEGTKFRFGFRVYRDVYADALTNTNIGEGIGEGFPLPMECNIDDKQREAVNSAFTKEISEVQVTLSEADDDFQENLYGGLQQVLQSDIVSCPDNIKLLFVIGDHGHQDIHKGQNKYASNVDRNALVNLLRGSDQPGTKSNNVIPFFIQTPSRSDNLINPVAYSTAYDQFASQTKYLLENSLPEDSSWSEHSLRMDEQKMVDRMVATVKKMGSSALIDEIILDIRGGSTMNAIIDRLRQRRSDIPGLFWHILKKGSCGELGAKCEQRIFDTTQVSYIEANDKVVEELRVSSLELSSWLDILEVFEGHARLPEEELRRALTKTMILGLQRKLGQTPINVVGETPAQYIQRAGGLPVRRNSPLLSYKLHSLAAEHVARTNDGKLIVVDRNSKPMRDANNQFLPVVPDCELSRLAIWANHSKEILEVVQGEFKKPVFKTTMYRPQNCPDATANGRSILRVERPIRSTPLGPDKSFRFSHTDGGRRVYWIPQKYLP